MADTKISSLPASTTPLAGTEVLPVVQSSTTKQVSVANLTAGRAVSAASLALTSSPLPTTSGGTALTSFTANGVMYASSTSALSTAGNIKYDGTNLGVGGAPNGYTYSAITPNGTAPSLGLTQTAWRTWAIKVGAAPADPALIFSDDSLGQSQLEISSAGNVTVKTGNIIPSTAAKGVNFTANTPAAGMTSQLLNWYEEGTWTPTLVTDGTGFTSVTYSSETGGRYVRIGKIVHFQMTVRTSAVTIGSASGNVLIDGLPFTAVTSSGSTQNGNSVAVGGVSVSWVTNNPVFGAIQNNSTKILLYISQAATTATVANVGTGAGANYLQLSGSYVCA